MVTIERIICKNNNTLFFFGNAGAVQMYYKEVEKAKSKRKILKQKPVKT